MTREAEAAILEELRDIRAKLDALARPAAPAEGVVAYALPERVMEDYKISRATLHRWVASGCPHEKRGKILRFKLPDVAAWFGGRTLRRVK